MHEVKQTIISAEQSLPCRSEVCFLCEISCQLSSHYLADQRYVFSVWAVTTLPIRGMFSVWAVTTLPIRGMFSLCEQSLRCRSEVCFLCVSSHYVADQRYVFCVSSHYVADQRYVFSVRYLVSWAVTTLPIRGMFSLWDILSALAYYIEQANNLFSSGNGSWFIAYTAINVLLFLSQWEPEFNWYYREQWICYTRAVIERYAAK